MSQFMIKRLFNSMDMDKIKYKITDIRCTKEHKVAEAIEHYILIKCHKCKKTYVSINTKLLNKKL